MRRLFAVRQFHPPHEAVGRNEPKHRLGVAVPRSDETWLPEWSGKLGGVERCVVLSRGVAWGKLVFQLTGLYPLAKSLARGGCNFRATERAHKRNVGQVDAEWRQPSLVTTFLFLF